MKYLLLFIFSFSFSAYCQTLTEKWNQYMNRYEYYDSANQLVGYKKYNTYNSSWEYFDNTQNNQQQANLIPSYDFDLMYKALAYKQGQFDNNVQGLQNSISDITNKINALDIDDELKTAIHNDFKANYIDVVNSKHYDYGNSNVVSQLISWFYQGAQTAVKVETEKYKAAHPVLYSNEVESQAAIQKSGQTKTIKTLKEINYHEGGYTSTEVVVEKYNPYKNNYEVVSRDTGAKIYFTDNQLYYFTKANKSWKSINWIYMYSDGYQHRFGDSTSYSYVTLSKDVDFIVIMDNPVGDQFTNRYTYKHLKKDPKIKKPF